MIPLHRLIALLLILIPDTALAASATVIGYHRFDGHRSSMSMPLAEFEAHLRYLKENANVISMDDFAGYVRRGESFPPRTVVITIDDGWSSVMDAFALLKKIDLPFTLFLPMAYMANPAAKRNLTAAEIDQLKAWSKVTFADHSYSHSPRLQAAETRTTRLTCPSCARIWPPRGSGFSSSSDIIPGTTRIPTATRTVPFRPCFRKTATN
jgi:hypothetical protein